MRTSYKIAVISLLGVLITMITLSCIPIKNVGLVHEGGLVNVDKYINTASLGKQGAGNSNFYLTYVNLSSPKVLLDKWIKREMGYEKSVATKTISGCQETTYDDDVGIGKHLLPIMRHNAISAAMTYLKMNPQNYLVKPIVIYPIQKYKTSKLFQSGDKILSVDGQGINSGYDFYYLVSKKKLGDLVTVQIDRESHSLEIKFQASEMNCNGEVTAGIYVSSNTEFMGIDEAKIINIDKMKFGGDSAGLMLSLATVQHLTPNIDFSHGYKIAGTGAIDHNGNIDEIGELEMKVRTAIQENADIFFYPASQTNEIKMDYKKQIRLFPVQTLTQAMNMLDTLSSK
jgi:PDZ domain-containing secreted protein